MTDQSHEMRLRYTIDDDGIWLYCACGYEKCLGFDVSPKGANEAVMAHLKEVYP